MLNSVISSSSASFWWVSELSSIGNVLITRCFSRNRRTVKAIQIATINITGIMISHNNVSLLVAWCGWCDGIIVRFSVSLVRVVGSLFKGSCETIDSVGVVGIDLKSQSLKIKILSSSSVQLKGLFRRSTLRKVANTRISFAVIFAILLCARFNMVYFSFAVTSCGTCLKPSFAQLMIPRWSEQEQWLGHAVAIDILNKNRRKIIFDTIFHCITNNVDENSYYDNLKLKSYWHITLCEIWNYLSL